MAGGEKREMVARLSGYATFANCSRGDVSALVDAGGRFALPAGWPLVQEGIPADACYVLTEGEARVFHDRDQIASLGPGDLIGEMALLEGGQRRATVTSATRVSGLRIENEKLRDLLPNHAALGEAFRSVRSAHGG